MHSLASVYIGEGKYPQAEMLYSQVLEIEHRVLGPEHRNTLASTDNLAIVYTAEGRYPQAKALYSQVLENPAPRARPRTSRHAAVYE